MHPRDLTKTFLRPALVLSFAAGILLFGSADTPSASDYHHAHLHDEHGIGTPMTDEAMARMVREYFETHPQVRPAAATGTPVVTFKAFSSKFDADGNSSGTPVDTVHIMVGETVGWQRLIGIHTVTSGANSADPQSGALFDVPLDSTTPLFDFTYNQAGTFPFYCIVHEDFSMFGVVIVEEPVGVTPLTGLPGTIGFTADPSPNPSRSGVSFRFALREAGLARAVVIDAGGRRVATVLDESLAPGTYGATWNGRLTSGDHARPGVYFVHLEVPGYRSAKRVVLVQ